MPSALVGLAYLPKQVADAIMLAPAVALHFYFKNLRQKPGNVDYTLRRVLLVQDSRLGHLGNLNEELDSKEFIIDSDDNTDTQTAQYDAVHLVFRRKSMGYGASKETKTDTLIVDRLNLYEILQQLDDVCKKDFVPKIKGTLRLLVQKYPNQMLTDVEIVELNDGSPSTELIQSSIEKTQGKRINVDSPIFGPSELNDIGVGLANIYVLDSLRFKIQSIWNHSENPPFQNLLPFVVVDCSDGSSQLSNGAEPPVPVGWFGTSVTVSVYSFKNGKELSHVVIDHPEHLTTLKLMKFDGLITEEQYRTELKKFSDTVSKLLIEKVRITNGRLPCTVYDGSIGLVEHIRNFEHTGKQDCPMYGTSNGDIGSDLECDGEDCVDGATSKNGGDNQSNNRQEFNTVPESSCKDCIVVSAEQDADECEWQVSRFDAAVSVNTDMVLAALKQHHHISDNTVRQLTIGSRSPHDQAGLVMRLVCFMITHGCVSLSEIAESIVGIKQRAVKSGKRTEKEEVVKSASAASPAEGQTAVLKDDSVARSSPKPTREPKAPIVRSQVIANILFIMIEDKKHFPYDFEVQLRSLVFELKENIARLRNSNGLSLLHSVVANNRPQFLLSLFRTGCWGDLRSLKAEDGPHKGKTAEEICTEMGHRKVLKEIDGYTTWEKSLNQIHVAARKGDLGEMKTLLKFSEDVHHGLDDKGCTTLYWAVIGGNIDIIKLLLNKKVDYKKTNSRKETLLHAACMLGHKHLLTTLVKDLKLDLTVKDSAKKSPLLRVAENGDEKSVAKLVKCGLKKEQLGPMLVISGHYGRLGFIKKLIEEYEVDLDSKDDAGKTVFMRACEQGRIDVAKYLLSKGAKITATDMRRRNVLHMAADGASVEIIEFLIGEIKSNSSEALKQMINFRDKYIGGELCMLIRGKDKGRDSWHYVEVCRGLMDIFMKKTRSGTIDVAKYGTLLHSGWGVDPDDESAKEIERRFETRRNASSEDYDVTPLHIAAFKDKEDVAELLMDNGSELNCRDKFGLTPLHVAAMRGNLPIVKSMLKRGAEADVMDNLLKTPIEVAEDNEHKDVANFIRSFQYIPVAQNFRDTILPNVLQLLSDDAIRRLQNDGRDLRTHLINTLRDLTIDINESLLALGSGPVLEESSPTENKN